MEKIFGGMDLRYFPSLRMTGCGNELDNRGNNGRTQEKRNGAGEISEINGIQTN